MSMLTITIITLLKVDGNPTPIDYIVPSLEGESPTRLEDTADEEEFEPVLESGERE